MAKSDKKISIGTLDEILKGQKSEGVTELWNGVEVKIRYTLPLSEMLAFVEEVVSGCFQEEYGYLPELRDFFFRCALLTRYANFRLPENLEHRYEIVYNTDAADLVMSHINLEQLNQIQSAIAAKIHYRCENNTAAVERKLNQVADSFEDLMKKVEDVFAGVTPEDIAKITSAVTDGGISEEKLLKAYADSFSAQQALASAT